MQRRPLINSHISGTPNRRQILSCVGIAGAATLFAKPASAMQTQDYNVKDVMTRANSRIIARDGMTSWDLLEKASFNNFTAPATLTPEIEALEGKTIQVEGFVMAYEEGETSRDFMLSAYATHCPFCSPGSMASVMSVQTTAPASLKANTLVVEGTFEIDRASQTGQIYYLSNAKVIQAA